MQSNRMCEKFSQYLSLIAAQKLTGLKSVTYWAWQSLILVFWNQTGIKRISPAFNRACHLSVNQKKERATQLANQKTALLYLG